MVALRRMGPRNRGTIPRLGYELASRGMQEKTAYDVVQYAGRFTNRAEVATT